MVSSLKLLADGMVLSKLSIINLPQGSRSRGASNFVFLPCLAIILGPGSQYFVIANVSYSCNSTARIKMSAEAELLLLLIKEQEWQLQVVAALMLSRIVHVMQTLKVWIVGARTTPVCLPVKVHSSITAEGFLWRWHGLPQKTATTKTSSQIKVCLWGISRSGHYSQRYQAREYSSDNKPPDKACRLWPFLG